MHKTEEKTLNSLVPLGLIHAFQNWFRGFQGQRVGDPRPCPKCGETTVWKNGYRTDRLFAILITEDGFDEITVEIQRYQCSECRHSYDGDSSEWFYEDCEYAKPVVDLCLFHVAENPFHACERILQNQYGLQVDRDTIQTYAERFGDEVADRHGVKIADATVSMNFLSLLFGVSTVEDLKATFADELAEEEIDGLVGVADETYPAKKGAKQDLYEENMRRKQKGKQPKKWPEGFTVGSSYLPQIGCFAGLQCRNTAFARALALALVFPLRGVDYWLTDDHDAYNDVLPNRVKCLIHRLRTRARGDERVSELHESGELEKLREYLEDEYETAYEELVETLRQDHPGFWDDATEEFTGPVSTNAIEGGNWRLKYGLGVPYARCRGARARTSLLALRDSMSTFENGEPAESFAHRHGSFSFDQVLGESSPQPRPPREEDQAAQTVA
jgi:transposase-like protein